MGDLSIMGFLAIGLFGYIFGKIIEVMWEGRHLLWNKNKDTRGGK